VTSYIYSNKHITKVLLLGYLLVLAGTMGLFTQRNYVHTVTKIKPGQLKDWRRGHFKAIPLLLFLPTEPKEVFFKKPAIERGCNLPAISKPQDKAQDTIAECRFKKGISPNKNRKK
jgi:hypothetical protein